jgi:hypothetical protein
MTVLNNHEEDKGVLEWEMNYRKASRIVNPSTRHNEGN